MVVVAGGGGASGGGGGASSCIMTFFPLYSVTRTVLPSNSLIS